MLAGVRHTLILNQWGSEQLTVYVHVDELVPSSVEDPDP